jgi:hypothetical protein
MRSLWLVLVSGVALAAPTSRYDGPRVSFTTPANSKVAEGSDIAADWALDVSVQAMPTTRFVVLGGDASVDESKLEAQATAWRDKRLRNRKSWGVANEGEHKVDSLRLGNRRVVRLVDDLSSTMTGRQVMLCAVVSTKLTCAVASAAPDTAHDAQAVLEQILSSITRR